MQSEKSWFKFTHVIRHHLVVSMQGHPPSITDSQSEDERFSNSICSGAISGLCVCIYLNTQNLFKCTMEADICCTLFYVFAERVGSSLTDFCSESSKNETTEICFMQFSKIN